MSNLINDTENLRYMLDTIYNKNIVHIGVQHTADPARER